MKTLLFYKCRWCGVVFSITSKVQPDVAAAGVVKRIPHHVPNLAVHECHAEEADKELKRRGVADFIGARGQREHPASE